MEFPVISGHLIEFKDHIDTYKYSFKVDEVNMF